MAIIRFSHPAHGFSDDEHTPQVLYRVSQFRKNMASRHKSKEDSSKLQSKEQKHLPKEGPAKSSHEASKSEPPDKSRTEDDSVTISSKSLLIGLVVVIAIALLVWRFQSMPSSPLETGSDKQTAVMVQDELVARVNGEDLMRSRITHQMEQLPAQVQGQVSFSEILDATINEMILMQEAKRLGMETQTAEANAYVAITLNQSGITRDELRKRAQSRGIDESEIVEIFRRRLTINDLLQREVFPTINVSDKDAKDWYEKNKAGLAIPETVEARHILLAQPEEANATLERVKKGAKFEDLAKDLSIDAATAVNGGDLGNFTKGMMVPEFEKAAWDAKSGSIVGPIKTQFGYHLIKIVGHHKGREKPFSEVRDLIIKQLKSERSESASNAYVQALRQKSDVQILVKDDKKPTNAGAPPVEG